MNLFLILYLSLPVLDVLDFLVHGAVAVVPGLGEPALGQCGTHGTALFAAVGAAGELALAQIRPELRERMLQIFLGDEPGAVGFQAGKARRIRNAPAKGFKDRHLTGGVAAAAQLLADGTGLALCFRQQAFNRVDLPTPELPQNAHSLPLIHCLTSSSPPPVS